MDVLQKMSTDEQIPNGIKLQQALLRNDNYAFWKAMQMTSDGTFPNKFFEFLDA